VSRKIEIENDLAMTYRTTPLEKAKNKRVMAFPLVSWNGIIKGRH